MTTVRQALNDTFCMHCGRPIAEGDDHSGVTLDPRTGPGISGAPIIELTCLQCAVDSADHFHSEVECFSARLGLLTKSHRENLKAAAEAAQAVADLAAPVNPPIAEAFRAQAERCRVMAEGPING